MSVITRYVFRQLAVGMVLVTIALACVLWLTQSLRLVEMIVNKGLSIGLFLYLTVLLLPNLLIVVVPISLFAVVLFTYNKMNIDRELAVLRSAGFSQWSLGKPAVLLALLVMVANYALNLYFVPKTVQDFHQLQWTIRNNITGMMLREGSFTQIATGLTVYVRARTAEGELLGIMVHDQRNPDKPVTVMAERGAMVQTATGPRVLMLNGNRQQVVLGTGRLSLLYFDNYAVEFGSRAMTDEERSRDARERSTGELFGVEPSQVSPVDYRRFRVEGHQRLASPFYNLSFTLVGLACLLSGQFSRRGQGARVMVAIGAMVAVQAAALGINNLATINLSLLPLLYVNAIVPGVVAAFFLFSPPRRRPRPQAPLPAA